MIIIAAMGEKTHVIGAGEGMPWNIPEEFNQFLRFISGETVIMGRRSYQIFKDHLTSRHNIVVSRTRAEIPGANVFPDLESALRRAEQLGRTIFSAGGRQLYEQTIPLANWMYLSFIKGVHQGDTLFPNWDENDWSISERRSHDQFEFVKYERRK